MVAPISAKYNNTRDASKNDPFWNLDMHSMLVPLESTARHRTSCRGNQANYQLT